jgi:hypothetical protein
MRIREAHKHVDPTDPDADPQAVLRVRDVYPGSWILIFTHSGSRIQKQQQKIGVKKISCQTFFCSHKFHKIVNYLIFKC